MRIRSYLYEFLDEYYDQFVPYMASKLAKYSKDLDGPFELLFDVFTGALIERRKFYGDPLTHDFFYVAWQGPAFGRKGEILIFSRC